MAERATRTAEELLLGEWACLGLIYPAPTHGFAVAAALKPAGEIGRVWSLSRPLTYRAIDQLVARDLVAVVGEERGIAGGNRTLVGATRSGRAQLRKWLRTPVEHLRDVRSELLLKLLLAERCAVEVGPMLVAQRARVAAMEAALAEQVGGHPDDVVARWRVESAGAARRFLDALIGPTALIRAVRSADAGSALDAERGYAAAMTAFDKLYINGAWAAPGSTETIDVIDSVTEEVMATIPAGTAADVDAAVAAAKAAFPAWSATPTEERAKYLTRIGDALGARMDEIATTISKETGMAKWLSQIVQVGLPINSFNSAAALVESYEFEETVGNSLIVREPIGVVGCITPWNYPLHQIAAKVAYAMAAGCTVVLKPSEVAPVDAFILADIINEVGLPAGVFNLVSGFGPVVGEAIAAHPDVDMVSFTGSTRAGKRGRPARRRDGQAHRPRARRQVGQRAARRPRRGRLRQGRRRRRRQVVPQLRADLLGADPHARPARAPGRGRADRRRRGRRRSRSATRSRRACTSARSLRPPSATGCRATSRRASTRAPRSSPAASVRRRASTRGFYVRPTVFSNVSPEMTIAQEEIFGPVLSILPYDTEDDAVPSPTASSTASPAACGRATRTTPARSPASCAPARSRSTAGRSTRTPRSAATSSPATAASTAATASRSSSRSSPSSSESSRTGPVADERWPGPWRVSGVVQEAGDVVGLAEVLQAVLDDADDAHGDGHRRVPAGVDDVVEARRGDRADQRHGHVVDRGLVPRQQVGAVEGRSGRPART